MASPDLTVEEICAQFVWRRQTPLEAAFLPVLAKAYDKFTRPVLDPEGNILHIFDDNKMDDLCDAMITFAHEYGTA